MLTERLFLRVHFIMVVIVYFHRGTLDKERGGYVGGGGESFVYIEESFFARILSCSDRIPSA